MKKSSTSNRRYRANNPEKSKAHAAVNTAIRSGRLLQRPCEKCGNPKTHAHHDDYARKLDVRWLCQACHESEHHGDYDTRKQKQREEKAAQDARRYEKIKSTRKPKPRPSKRSGMLTQACRLRESGAGYGAIADILGVGKGTVYKWLNNTQYK